MFDLYALFIFKFIILVWLSGVSSSENVYLLNNVSANNRNEIFNSYRSRRSVLSATILVKSSECSEFSHFCQSRTDFDLLMCANDHKDSSKDGGTIPVSCLGKIKPYLIKVLKGSFLKDVADFYCSTELSSLDCNNRIVHNENLFDCLVNSVSNIKNEDCINFIKKLKLLPFFNYDTMMVFIGDCLDDIAKLDCDRNKALGKSVPLTLSCLQGSIDQLNQVCRDQVLYISELQGDTANYDHGLLKICEKERLLYCSDLSPVNLDPIYRCLISHREDRHISPKCNEELYRHEKIIARDYQISKGLVKACKDDIRAYQCRKSVSNHKFIRLSQILLCLENASHAGGKIHPSCRDEMIGHRRMLMEDYRLSPELVTGCSDEIRKLCSKFEEGGKTIHCLMEHSRLHISRSSVSSQCQRQLEILVKEVNVVDDWSVDPVLRQSCHDVVSIACRNMKSAEVMSCLMEHLGSQVMTEDCEAALLQIQYFVARDYKLDPRLYHACHENAVQLCHAARDWAPGPSSSMDPERGPLVLPCLYRYASLSPQESINKLSEDCITEIKRVMKERALRVELHPEVETACINDLALFCVDKTAHRQEITCLQDKLDQLTPHCKEAVYNFTEIQSVHIELLNPLVTSNCQQVISSLCQDYVNRGVTSDLMDCLIDHKNHQLMKYNHRCKAVIDHHQLISLKDYHFTLKFKEACKSYVNRFCSGSKTKAEVVACLSEIMQNDTLMDHKQRIPKECRQQIKAQLLQSRENIAFNPSLNQACAKDVQKFCNLITPGNANILECLEGHRKKLSTNCHRMIFKLERQDLADSSTDYTLLTTCQQMINKYCRDNDSKDALSCLKKYKYEADFDPACRVVVVRRMIEQYSNYRLNPGIMSGCRLDVAQYCAAVVANQHNDDAELDGKVINCLKNKFRERKLSKECEKKLIVVLQESALNYQLNPLLTSLCVNEIQNLCKKEAEKDQLGTGGVEECLKRALLDGKLENRPCKLEVLELIRERKADIEADPLLHTACLHDITHYCSDIAKGDKRQLNCLIEVLAANDKSRQLQSECKTMLSERLEMYKVEKQIYVENLEQLVNQFSNSPSHKYFMVMALTMVGMIFMSGMFCGRMVRRSHAASKNK